MLLMRSASSGIERAVVWRKVEREKGRLRTGAPSSARVATGAFGSGSSSAMFEVRGGLMVENEYYKEGMNFSIPLKDSRLIAEHAAQSLVPTPIYHAALQTYYAAVAQGHGDEDQSAVCAAMERAANCEREKKNQPES